MFTNRNRVTSSWRTAITGEILYTAWKDECFEQRNCWNLPSFKTGLWSAKVTFQFEKFVTGSPKPACSALLLLFQSFPSLAGSMDFLRLGRWVLAVFYCHIHTYFPLLKVSKVCAKGNQWRMSLGFSCWSEKLYPGSLKSLCCYSVQSTF